ncbi:MAG: pantetheine-phosphate adenylyltransferase, partial [Nitrospirae bacterium GWD2_44_7]
MKKTAIYPGTFDPITNGHIDLVKRGMRIFDEVIIAIATAQKKQPLFTISERLKLIKDAVRGLKNVKVEAFSGLLVEYVESKKGVAVIRGLRAVSDF